MKRSSLWLLLTLAGSAGLQAQSEPPAASTYDSLLTNSPFGNAALTGVATVNTPLELRGIIVDKGETFFSVYDPASRTSRWVGMNEAGNPYTVRSYDAAKSEVKVQYQGRELTLGLKQARVVAMSTPPPAPPVAVAGPNPSGGPQPVAVAGNAPAGDEAQRLAQIAEEIRRRRALRQQAAQGSSGPVPMPVPSNSPPPTPR